MCSYVAAGLNLEVAKRDLCASSTMRSVADASMRQCIFLLMSISQDIPVLALSVFKSLCG